MPARDTADGIPLAQYPENRSGSPVPDEDVSDNDALLGSPATYNKSAVSSYNYRQSSWLRRLTSIISRRGRRHHSRPSHPASLWRRILRYAWISICAFILVSVLNGIFRPSFQHPPAHYQELAERVQGSTDQGRGNPNKDKIFIAANIIDEEKIRGPWGESILSLVELLGDENVFVSIYENDSGSGTSDALVELRSKLSCNTSIITGAHLPLSGFPTVHVPSGEDRVQRITYLAEVRNRLLRPLDVTHVDDTDPGFHSVADVSFDRILFINDVYFNPVDAVQLLFSTNADSGKAEYRTACAFDFTMGVFFYDSFVVRDTDGFQIGFMTYPWFTTMGTGRTRQLVKQQVDAVPVRSCWGGMAAFDAAVFQTKRSNLPDAKELAIMPSPFIGTEISPQVPATFRGSGEAFWEAAECCLIFADIEVLFGFPDVETGTGVFVNPYIRVAYTRTTWNWLPFWHRYERGFEFLQYIVSKVGYPEFNPRRTHKHGQRVEERVWTQHKPEEGGDRFETIEREAPLGGFCGQRRMFAMKTDLEKSNMEGNHKNWDKVPIPPGFK